MDRDRPGDGQIDWIPALSRLWQVRRVDLARSLHDNRRENGAQKVSYRKATPLKPPMRTLEDFTRFQLIGEIAEVIYIAKKETYTPIGHVMHEDLLRYGFEPTGEPLPYPVYLRHSVQVHTEETIHIINVHPPKQI